MARLSPAKRKLARLKRKNSLLTRQNRAIQHIAVHHFNRAKELEQLILNDAVQESKATPVEDVVNVCNGPEPLENSNV